MLLTDLMPTEITDNDITKMNHFLDKYQTHKKCNKSEIEDLFSEEKYNLLKEWLFANKSTVVHYSCDLDDNIERESSQEEENCPLCQNLVADEQYHEFDVFYTFNIGLLDTLRDTIVEYQRKKYFTDHTRYNLESLKSELSGIIPFIGAGLSMPLGLPSWYNLLKMLPTHFPKDFHDSAYLDYADNGSFLRALSYLKEHSMRLNRDDQIKDEIIKIIRTSEKKEITAREHNIGDILRLNSNFYITTNYDHCIEDFASKQGNYRSPLSLEDIDNMVALFEKDGEVLHIHGHINRKDTMIVTQEDYEKLYNNLDLMDKIKIVLASKTCLFIGFSFNDEFFEDMYDRLHKVIKGHHYIVLANPTIEQVRYYNKDKDVRVIGLELPLDKDRKPIYDEFVPAFRTLIDFLIA
ncbi:SIR2 family protein [Paenibacillus sp. MDMC362]|uniref:SIR2 family NAD-dependent protein deacylase n=1 Tax=Paenibacillus sp. MDMC362 TaxID=2977365 RepID=UPI000DC60D4B|nr:SIR2 family protein [Paenibacillus sp. MDMC362]RAR44146.1 hypothetical protein DP091_09800 [Paenibacillus sp. MDMC362]